MDGKSMLAVIMLSAALMGASVLYPSVALQIVVPIFVVGACCYGCCCNETKGEEGSGAGDEEGRRPHRYADSPFSATRSVVCHLCLSRVLERDWADRTHRRGCVAQNQAFLSTLPMPYSIYCPKCSRTLRLWPARGPEFLCREGQVCVNGGGPLVNSGGNRMSCFDCNYNLCSGCVEARLEEVLPINWSSNNAAVAGDETATAAATTAAAATQDPFPPSAPFPPAGLSLNTSTRPIPSEEDQLTPPPSYEEAVANQ